MCVTSFARCEDSMSAKRLIHASLRKVLRMVIISEIKVRIEILYY